MACFPIVVGCWLACALPVVVAILDPDLFASGYPPPKTGAGSCGNLAKLEKKLDSFETFICDPDNSLAHSLRPDQGKFAFAAIRAWERDFAMRAMGVYGVHAGVALVSRTLQPIQQWARAVAAAWGLENATGVLVALRTGDRPAVAFAGGLMEDESAFEAAHEGWIADVSLDVVNALRLGVPGRAIELALTGLSDAIGGGLGHAMHSLGGVVGSAAQGLVGKGESQGRAVEVWKSACAEERCLELYVDDARRLSDRFEAYYHEAMTYPALNILSAVGVPKRVLILGDDDGGLVGRVLGFEGIEHVTWVGADATIGQLIRQHFPDLVFAWSDSRLNKIQAGVAAWVLEQSSKATTHLYDFVVLDFVGAPTARPDFAKFFGALRELMTPTGIVMQNFGALAEFDSIAELQRLHRNTFVDTYVLLPHLPDFEAEYMLGLSGVAKVDPFAVDWVAWERQDIHTEYYSPDVHHALFALTAAVARALGLPVGTAPSVLTPLQSFRQDVRLRPPGAGATDLPPLPDIGRAHSQWQVMRGPGGYCDPALPAGDCRWLLNGKRPVLSCAALLQAEAMTLPAMNILGRRTRRVLVLGGGTGYVASLVLQYPHVERVVIVEVDSSVREIVGEVFPSLREALSDPRVEYVRADAYEWMRNHSEAFDFIAVLLQQNNWEASSTTSRVPFTSRFMADLRRGLTSDGLLAQGAGSVQTPRQAARLAALHRAAFATGSVWPLAHGLDERVFDGSLCGHFLSNTSCFIEQENADGHWPKKAPSATADTCAHLRSAS